MKVRQSKLIWDKVDVYKRQASGGGVRVLGARLASQGTDAVGQLTQACGQRTHRVRAELFFNSLEHQLTLEFVGQADGVVRVDHNSLHGLALLFSY